MNSLELVSQSTEQTQKLGVRIGELALAGDVFLLLGELGTGKTCLTQGIAWGLGIKEYAMSPSFVIVRELYGTLVASGAERAILACPAGFTKGARESALGTPIQLVSAGDLVEMAEGICQEE